MDVAAISLTGRALRVEPLGLQHAPDIAAAADPEAMRYMLDRPATGETLEAERYIARLLGDPGRVVFAIVDIASGRTLGSSSYLDIRAKDRGLEIGNSWIARSAQGSHVNPEAKFLLLRHAFETLGCLRVQLKTDARNQQSQRAMEKLGCTREGLLRRHMILPDGFVRDTVMYSILDNEWPALREKLVQRLGYRP